MHPVLEDLIALLQLERVGLGVAGARLAVPALGQDLAVAGGFTAVGSACLPLSS